MLFKMPIDDTHQARLVLHSRDAAQRRRIARRDERKRAARAADEQNTIRTYNDHDPETLTARMDNLILRAYSKHAMVRVYYFEEVGDRYTTCLDGYLEGYTYQRSQGCLTEIKIGSGLTGTGIARIPTGHIRTIAIVG